MFAAEKYSATSFSSGAPCVCFGICNPVSFSYEITCSLHSSLFYVLFNLFVVALAFRYPSLVMDVDDEASSALPKFCGSSHVSCHTAQLSCSFRRCSRILLRVPSVFTYFLTVIRTCVIRWCCMSLPLRLCAHMLSYRWVHILAFLRRHCPWCRLLLPQLSHCTSTVSCLLLFSVL